MNKRHLKKCACFANCPFTLHAHRPAKEYWKPLFQKCLPYSDGLFPTCIAECTSKFNGERGPLVFFNQRSFRCN